jgi:tricorn protease
MTSFQKMSSLNKKISTFSHLKFKRMKISLVFVFALFCSNLMAQNNGAYFLANPCITPDGKTVIFSYEGDLWKTDLASKKATRITAMQGYETSPRVSPDGNWLAFTGRQYGNGDVYIMPINGGEIKQITYHSGNDEVTSWSWDSKSVYFNSGRMGQIAGFNVAANGGTPKRVFGNYFFQYDHNLLEHPINGEIFFNDTWESSNQMQRKRYKGPFNPDVQSYNLKTKTHKKYTNWQGKDFATTIDKAGNIYFISDEANGEYNLYTINNGKKKALTNFGTSIKSPMVNANGGLIVFEKDYQLWLYDVKKETTEKLDITITRNNILPKEKDFDVKGNISAFDVSADGKKIAFIARGEIFVSDVEGKFIQQIDKKSAERATEIKWMADNKTLLFAQTFNGYTNYFSLRADTVATLKQHTTDVKNNRSMVLNKKRTQAVYLSGRNEVKIMDLKTYTSKTIVTDEIWGFQNSAPGFSFNDEYVIFTAYRNFEQDVLIHNIKENKTTNITNTGITESEPFWSADGKNIYFTCQRLKANYPFGSPNARIYKLPLEKLDEPYKIDKYNELFAEETKKDTSKKAASLSKNITIDFDRLMERLELVSPNFGEQTLQNIYQKGDKTSVLYISNHSEGKRALYKTLIEPFEQNKTEKIVGTDGVGGIDMVEVSDKIFILANGTLHKLNLDANKADPINISFTYRRNLAEEFNQMLYEAWAQMEENFYDENFGGLDWKKTKTYYQQFLPHLNTRSDLRLLLNDMLGELNSSHQGFGTFGDDETIALQNRTMETGIIFENDKPFTIKNIAKRSAAERKSIDLKPGDILIKVNDENVDENMDRNFYFTKPSLDKELKLTFKRNQETIQVKVHPQTTLFNNLYDEWMDDNQNRVNSKSNNRIAYGHMKNMGTQELEQFIIDMTKEQIEKDALILDLRYNTGGNVHDELLNFLSRKSYLKWKYREGKTTTQANFAPADKPIVLLINEQSLSDAEMTAQGFKALKLGTIVGTETYRWIIFTSGVSLVDGSSVRMPAWGCYTLEGKANSFDDKLNGRDPQLDKAIELILKQLK